MCKFDWSQNGAEILRPEIFHPFFHQSVCRNGCGRQREFGEIQGRHHYCTVPSRLHYIGKELFDHPPRDGKFNGPQFQ
jgi:hypothetical protein